MTYESSSLVATTAIGQTTGSLITTRHPKITLNWEGVVGDLHAGYQRPAEVRVPWYVRGTPMRNERQLTVVSEEELSATAQALGIPVLQPEWIGANVMVRGIPDLTFLFPTTRLVFSSGAVLVVINENRPCRSAADSVQLHNPTSTGIAQNFVKHAHHRRGVIACVEIPGDISPNDEVTVDAPKNWAWMTRLTRSKL